MEWDPLDAFREVRRQFPARQTGSFGQATPGGYSTSTPGQATPGGLSTSNPGQAKPGDFSATTPGQAKPGDFSATTPGQAKPGDFGDSRRVVRGGPAAAVPTSAVPSEAPSISGPPEYPKGELDDPTNTEIWNGQIQNFFQSDTRGANRMDGLYKGFDPNQKSYQEQLYGQDPGLSGYYDRAFDTGSAKLNNQFNAKGFGSTAHANALTGFGADLYADQAFREADYRQRNAAGADAGRAGRYGIAGDLATGADAREQTQANYDVNKLTFQGGAAKAADESRFRNRELAYKMQNDMLANILGLDLTAGLGEFEDLMDAANRGVVSAAEDKATAVGDEADRYRQGVVDVGSAIAGIPPGTVPTPGTQPRPVDRAGDHKSNYTGTHTSRYSPPPR